MSTFRKPGDLDCDNAETTAASLNDRESKTLDWERQGSPHDVHDNSLQTMQLSLDTSGTCQDLPSHQIADSFAFMLILANLPDVLLVVAHLLFSLNEYVSASSPGSTPSKSPLFSIFVIDFVVVMLSLFTPSLRSAIIDISHVIISVTMAGAKWQSTFPLILTVSALRGSLHKVNDYLEFSSCAKEGSWQNLWIYRLFSQLIRYSKRLPLNHATSITPALDHVKSALAIHVFSLGIIGSASYWGRKESFDETEQEHASFRGAKLKTGSSIYHGNAGILSLTSIWDPILRWRAEFSGRKYGLTQNVTPADHYNICVSEIMQKYLVFSLQMRQDCTPEVNIRVNGLLWEANLVSHADCSNSSLTLWTIRVENLSPKTEYDISLRISSPLSPTGTYEFSVCTTVRESVARPHIAECFALPSAINTSSDGQLSCIESTDCSPGLLPSVTALETSITTASLRLEEKKTALKRSRKDNAKRIQSLQRELDHFTSRMAAGIDKNEQRAQGRMLSLQTEIKRMQDAIEEMEQEKIALAELISEQQTVWAEEKEKHEAKTELLNSVRQTYNTEVAKHQKRLATVELESARIRGKAEKLSLRRTKIQQELDRISSEQDHVLDLELKERISHREAMSNHRLQVEAEFLKSILEFSQRSELLEMYS